MALEFDSGKHIYRLDGERCPSVTQVVNSVLAKPGLEWWSYRLAINGVLELLRRCTVDPDDPDAYDQVAKALNILGLSPNVVVSDAAAKGVALHRLFVQFAATGTVTAEASVAGFAKSLMAFIEANKPKIIDVEQHVHSESLRVAGTYDALLEIGGQLVLVDWKTSRKIYDAHHLQAAAYAGMRNELGRDPATPLIVRLDPDGGEPECMEARATYEEFAAACVLHHARKRIAKAPKPALCAA